MAAAYQDAAMDALAQDIQNTIDDIVAENTSIQPNPASAINVIDEDGNVVGTIGGSSPTSSGLGLGRPIGGAQWGP